jgi:putative intracellular protease/amidase
MKTHHPILALCAGTVIFAAAGCGKTDTSPKPTVAPQAQSAPDAPSTVVLPTPPLPVPDRPPKAEGPDPKPGDAGSHSSPAFKDGGKPDSPK